MAKSFLAAILALCMTGSVLTACSDSSDDPSESNVVTGNVVEKPIIKNGETSDSDNDADSTRGSNDDEINSNYYIDDSDTEADNSQEFLYKEILDLYYSSILNGWTTFSEDQMSYLWPISLVDNLSDAGYQFIDLDGNGVDELIVTLYGTEGYDDGSQNVIYDLYTWKDGEIIHLCSSEERDRYGLCSDNTLINGGSGGALESYSISFSVDSDSGSLKFNEIALFDGYSDDSFPLYYSNSDNCIVYYGNIIDHFDISKMERISDEQYNEYLKIHASVPLDLTPFSDYKADL